MNLANIFQVRVPEESAGIVSLVDGKKVVIVGTSFIGMEAAAYVAKKAASVIAIGMEKVPFERVLGISTASFFIANSFSKDLKSELLFKNFTKRMAFNSVFKKSLKNFKEPMEK